MNTGEFIAVCLVAAVGAYVLFSRTARAPRPSSWPRPRVNAVRKTPLAVGDINLYDSEDPNYCGKCKKWCDSAFFEGHSTQCDQCQATCPGAQIA